MRRKRQGQELGWFVMLLWVYIHTRQTWKIYLATVGIEPTTFGLLAQCSANWATRSGQFECAAQIVTNMNETLIILHLQQMAGI